MASAAALLVKAPPPFAKGAPSSGPLAPGGGLLFAPPPSEPLVHAAMPSDPPAPAFFGPLGGSLSKASSMGGPMPPLGLAELPVAMPPGLGRPPPGEPPGPPQFPAPREGNEPPGPPSGLPPGLPPMGMPPGMPPLLGMPPPGFPPGMGPVTSPLGFAPEGAKLPDGAASRSAEMATAEAPPGSPPKGPAARPEVKKRKKGVEGLASNKAIRNNGGAVTVYSGYDAMTIAPKEKPPPEKPAAPAQVTGSGGVTQALQRQLPEGWEMRKSRSTGKVYYVNERLGKSQFEPPAGSTIDKKVDPKKKKASTRTKEIPDAQFTDRGGMMGLMRATEQKKGRWAKWQKCNELLNEPDPEELARARGDEDDMPRWKGKGKGKGRRRDDDDLD